jgi:hypothetical protein
MSALAFFTPWGSGLVQGRVFEQKDVDSPTGFFVVNQAFAQKHLAGRDSIGAHILIGIMSPKPSSIPVIGVVANAHDLGIEAKPQPEIYLPGYGLHAVLLVRTGAAPKSIVPMVRSAVHHLDSGLAIYNVKAVDNVALRFACTAKDDSGTAWYLRLGCCGAGGDWYLRSAGLFR